MRLASGGSTPAFVRANAYSVLAPAPCFGECGEVAMPRFDKTCVTQFANTGCEKQLRFTLHPDTVRHRSERVALDMPHPQIRPGAGGDPQRRQ